MSRKFPIVPKAQGTLHLLDALVRTEEESLKEFLKTTIIGGTAFLLPAALVLFILSYALRLMKRLAGPISHGLQLDQLGELTGIGAATVL